MVRNQINLKSLLALALPLTIFSACATPDSNPHYKVSSKYPSAPQQTGAVVQQADHRVPAPVSYAQTRTQNDPQGRQQQETQPYAEAYGHEAQTDYAAQDYQNYSEYDITPQSTAVQYEHGQTINANTQPQPLELAAQTIQTAEITMTETGGQNGGSGGIYLQDAQPYTYVPAQESQAAQSLQAAAPSAPAASMATRAISIEAFTPELTTGQSYIVQEGDTAYSLSRKTCSSVGEVKDLNRLDGAFTIRAGETIKLPQSRC